MQFKPNWYNEGPVIDVPTFQELDDITASAFDDKGNYIGPKEKPDMQLVVDNTSGRKFFARKDYDDDAVKYAMAKFNEAFSPEEWWGMQNDPVLSTFENVSVAGINGVKMALRAIATVPTTFVSGGVGMLNALQQSYLERSQAPETITRAIKSRSMGLDNLYRASAKNWESTLDKLGLGAAQENIAANSVLVQIGNMVGQTGASLLTAAAFSSVGGLPAVAAVFGTTQYQEIREEYLAKGYSLDQANTFALLAGLAEGGLEAVGFKYFKRFATMHKSINNSLIASTTEALQEASQTLSETAITNITGLRADDFKSILLDVLISAVAGGIVGAAGSIVTGQAEQRIEKIVETAEDITKPGKALPAPSTKLTIEQEIEQAKKTKSNQLYNIVRAIGQEEKLDEKAIDFIYKVAKKELEKGTTPQMLLEGVGKQVVAYKDALDKGQFKDNPEIKEAAEKIQYAISQQSVDDFRNKRKSELEKMGVDEETANAVAQQTTDIYQTLSNQLGIDINEIRPVEVEFAPTTTKTEQTPAQQYNTFREVVDRINEIDEAIKELDNSGKAPKTTLLSVLRRTGVDYSQTRLDPAVLRDLRIKNKSVRAGGLGAEALDYLRRNNFMEEVETATYEDLAQQTEKAEKMLMDTLAGKRVYSLDKGTQLQEAEQVEFAKYQLQQERDELVQDATRGQIRFEDTLDRIILGKYADASTMLHELMHHWENVIEIAAAKGNKRAIQLKEAKDKIINENWRKTKQDVNQRLEVLSEAYEKWLYMGAKSKSPKRQGLFNAIRKYMQKVYDSAKAITGIRIDQNIDAFFKEITGETSVIPTNLYQTGIDYKNGKADINSESFKKWFGNSKVVDENGKPLVVYHGSEYDFDVFDRTKTRANMDIQGNFFSPWELDAQGYGRNVRAFYLSIKNPAPEAVAYAALKKYQGQNNAGIKAREELERMGYDGVNNSNEEYIAFYPEQIKSVYNRGTWNADNPNILYQTGRDLFATHNMNLAGAKQALKLGGLAMPSMAIRKTNTESVLDFGEVSFVANEKMVTPSRGTEVYDRDAWTPSLYNSLKYRLSKNAKQKIEDILKKTGEEKKWSMYVYNIEENLFNATRNDLALDLFLKEKGLSEKERSEKYNSPDYIEWYNKNFFDDATPYLYTENDANTDMVERKFTLNNVMKILRKQERTAGGYIGDHLFSVQELIKFFPQKFRNLKELRSKKQNLQNSEQIFNKIEELDKDFDTLAADLRKTGKEKEYGSDRHAIGIAIANTGNLETQKYWLESAGLPTDNETISKIDRFADRIKNEIPVSYFEVKPRRVVDFGQFSGVIMPNTKEYDSLANDLETKYYLPVFRIEKGNAEEYRKALFEIQKQRPTTLFQTVRAQKTGEQAADERPSDEQIEKDLAAIKNNGIEKYQPKGRFVNSLSEFTKDIILTIRQRAGAIDPKIKAFFDKLDYWEANMERAFAQQTEGWLKKYKALSEEEKNEFDYYVYNHLTDRLSAFVKQKGMEKEYAQVRKTLDFVYQIANQAGIDMGFIGEYFPTSIKDYGAFMDALRGTDKWTYIEKALRELDPKGTMSEAERADAVNKIIRGYHRLDPVSKPSGAKERRILYKNPEFMRYYEHSDMALIKYMSSMTQAFAINRAFGKGKGFNTEETIGQIVLDLVESGTITRAEETEIKKLLKSRLSYSSTPAFVSLIKNVGYLQMMNNFTSGITQLGDLSVSMYKYGFGNTMQALFGKKNITKKDLGLERIAEEYMDRSKAGVAVDKLFKVVGLNAFDSLGKTTAINAGLLKLRKQAQKGDLELFEKLAYTFGSQASKVLTDIKNGNITEDVKIMLWAELADAQPIGKSGMPRAYWDNPRGRLFYQLKTYTTNQLSLYYADCLLNISRGLQYKDKKMFLKGVGNLFKLAMLLTAGNATMDVLKNLLMGRHIDISDVVVSNLLWNVGVSKYIFYKGKREGYARALLSSFLLPPQTGILDDVQLDIRRIASGKKKLKDTYLVNYLPFGRSYYWWFGGGRTQEKKDRRKRKRE